MTRTQEPAVAPEAPAAEPERLSRRSMLGAAGGAAAGLVASALLQPRSAAAATGDGVKAGNVTLAEASTEVRYDGNTGFGGIVLLGNDSTHTTAGGTWFYPAAVAGMAGASTGGSAGHGIPSGVHGYTETGSGYGVIGVNIAQDLTTGGAGVYGYCAATNGVGVLATHGSNGLALEVVGKAAFARSGRALIQPNQTTVDVSVPSGLAIGNILATLQQDRSGVWVRACRRNYPTMNTFRIYLNKVASATNTTPVAWFIFEDPAFT
ncbi:MAG TPA: hypothetical protein VGI98_01670 [Candidatus Limnocylindrales bacterium]